MIYLVIFVVVVLIEFLVNEIIKSNKIQNEKLKVLAERFIGKEIELCREYPLPNCLTIGKKYEVIDVATGYKIISKHADIPFYVLYVTDDNGNVLPVNPLFFNIEEDGKTNP